MLTKQDKAQQHRVNMLWDMLYVGNCIISYYFIICYGKNDSRDLDLASSLWRHQMETFFRVTGPFYGEFTGHRWIAPTKASDAEL